MLMPATAREVRLFGVVPACWLVGESNPPTPLMRMLLDRTKVLMRL